MKFFASLLIPVMVLILASCGQPASLKDKHSLTLAEQNMVLTGDDVFDGDKIRVYLRKDSLDANKANQFFLRGLDYLKNKQEPQAAIDEFVESIKIYPNAKAYYELGNAYMEKKRYNEAVQAYGLAEQLNYEPYSNVLFNMACANSRLEKQELSAQYLEYAVEAGYLNIENIEKDADLEYLRTEYNYLYKKHLNKALAGTSNAENRFWIQFKRGFTKAKLPLSLTNLVSSTRFDLENHITYDFEKFVPEMRDEKFSREVSKGFYFHSLVAEKENFVALVYIIRDEFMGDEAPLSYRLVTFNHEGKIIDQYLIAGRANYTDLLRLGTISNDLTITIDLMETQFEKDIDENGPYDNPIKSKKKVGQEIVRIAPTGKIEKVEGKPLG